ncbi:class I SAM-dependent methyltransferase [Indiicoccus explosivorum]|uniref:class I SAM-dependent methyltransferase n=1 Tax=Indiicoccus explosivorum TaxID=1917864 RepID=UPI000B4451B7|nr:class I SAM-dependent methyltransferase [Indiicoccus explosivorum]
MSNSYRDDLFDSYLKDADEPFAGWDFSFISDTGRLQNGALPWSYASIVLPYFWKSVSVLDMGTGGGEFLAKLQPFPANLCATEGYAPNVPVAKRKLEPLGVRVEQEFDQEDQPFPDSAFDLILNRHKNFSAKEVRRMLKDGGTFITQQVGGRDCREINEALGEPSNPRTAHSELEPMCEALEQEGFTVTLKREAFPVQRFYDIGALVYYLKAIPWQVPGFTVEKYRDELFAIHERILQEGFFEVTQQRYLLVAVI